MKHLIYFSIITLTLTGLCQAQALKIAVVDLEQSLNSYQRTTEEKKKINDLGNKLIRHIDEQKAVYEKMTDEMTKLDSDARTASGDEKEKLLSILQEKAKVRNDKANEIMAAQRNADQDLFEARKEMEKVLMIDINTVVKQVADGYKFDVVFDKSFLPKTETKSIVYISTNVPDVTNEVIARLNTAP